MGNSTSITEVLAERKKLIFELWYQTVQRELPGAQGERKTVILNSLPSLFDRLILTLGRPTPAEDATADNMLPSEHGFQRATLANFSADQIVREFHLLQDVLIEQVTEVFEPSYPDLRIIRNTLNSAMLEAVQAYIATVENRKNEVETEFKLLVDEVKDYAIFMVDLQGIVVSWNEGAARIKGYSANEVIGQHYRMLYRDDDQRDGRPERNMALAVENGRHEDHWWRRKKDGGYFWASTTMTLIKSRSGKNLGFSKVVRDLTAAKQAEDELREAKVAAETANELKSAFLANMSHEIRTPLGAVLGFAEALRDPDLAPSEAERFHSIIQRNGRILTRLIDDILDLSRVESGKLEVRYVDVQLRQVMAEVIGIAELKANEKGIHIEMHIDDVVPDAIVTDVVRFRQILSNIIGNAVKFTDRGHVKIDVAYDKHLLRKNNLNILVTDTGPGIPEESHAKLFKPFVQADDSSTRKHGGTGLGLALSKRLANELGGDLELLSCPPGTGCTFRITVADRFDAHKETSSEHPGVPANKKPAEDLKGRNVLLVEDSKDNQLLIARLLTRLGANVDVASNGVEGFDRATQKPYDLILMDVQMPVLDGISATKKLRATGYSGPIVALTAHAMQEQRMACLSAGCNDHLTKPVDSGALIKTVKTFVAPERVQPSFHA